MAIIAAAGAAATAAYLNGKYQLGRELSYLWRARKAMKDYERRVAQDIVSPWYVMEEVCTRQPHLRALWTRERSWTFQQFHEQVVRYANWLIEQGIKPGDLVALYLHNSAEFMILVFATHCIGAAPALINYNLEGRALLHCLNVCASKILIVDVDEGCQRRIEGSRSEIESSGTKIFNLDSTLKNTVSSFSTKVPDHSWRTGTAGDFPMALIYTSGTTGLPKGCPFTISRVYLIGQHLNPSFATKPGVDCWYCPMPLYHGTGLMTAIMSLMGGVAVAISPRFSVSRFWKDIHDSESTSFIYVGETARYLLNAPPDPYERKHNLRFAYGNGLRPDVWLKMQQRFNIPEIAEFFNSSEGVFGLVVWDRSGYSRGSVGHHGLILRSQLQNVYIPVQIDHDTGDIWRDPNTGFAKRLTYDEGGEILVAVPGREAFGGYWRNEEATNKRFATDVFQKGDLFYRSGDALRRTPDGHWHFLDRLGDTFRWKSENVSTAEVALALQRHPGINEANVYGVSVPGHEGRAGCAAIKLDNSSNFDFAELLHLARAELPAYGVPLFIRIVKDSSHIHNHKQNKVGLRKEGIDPNLIGTEEKEGKNDSILWLGKDKQGNEAYVPFTTHDWAKLVNGQARL